MKIALTNYQTQKLSAVIEVVGLLILMSAYTVFLKGEVELIAMIAIADILACGLISLLLLSVPWINKAERKAQKGGALAWRGWNLALYLLLPVAVTLTGLIATLGYRNTDIANLMIIVLAGYLGFSLGYMVKIRLRF